MPPTATPKSLLLAALLALPLVALSTGSAEASIPRREESTLAASSSLSETRLRASDFLGEDDVRGETGLSPDLLRGSAEPCAGIASGSGEFRIFDPAGNALSTSAYGWTRLFQGREYIPMLDAYDFRARTLWPELGRFGQEDPAGTVDSTNRYQALNGAWTGYADPLGLLTVYVWDFVSSKGDHPVFGHASVGLDDGVTHISWWPSANLEERRGPLRRFRIYTAPANEDQTLDDDIVMEKHPPDHKLRIVGLNEKAIREWWIRFRGDENNEWNTLSPNCSTVTAMALEAGGAYLPSHVVWTPSDILSLVELVRRQLYMTGSKSPLHGMPIPPALSRSFQ